MVHRRAAPLGVQGKWVVGIDVRESARRLVRRFGMTVVAYALDGLGPRSWSAGRWRDPSPSYASRRRRSVTNKPDVLMGALLRSPAQGSHRVNPGATSCCGQTVQLLKQHGDLPGVEDGIRERADTGEHGKLRPVDLCERLVPGDTMFGPSYNAPGLVTNLQVDHRVKLSPGEPTAHPIYCTPRSIGRHAK